MPHSEDFIPARPLHSVTLQPDELAAFELLWDDPAGALEAMRTIARRGREPLLRERVRPELDVRDLVRCPAGHRWAGTLSYRAITEPVGADGSHAGTITEEVEHELETYAIVRDWDGRDRVLRFLRELGSALHVLICSEGCEFTDARVTDRVLIGTSRGECVGGHETVMGFPCGDSTCACATSARPL